MSNNDDKNNNAEEAIQMPSGAIIDKRIYLFLFSLMGKIFLKNPKTNEKKEEKLKEWINEINKKIIHNERKYINSEYDIKNFRNIIDFVKSQNKTLAGDILEDIFILIFSYAFQTEKTNTFGEFIYTNNGKSKLEDSNNFDLVNWFNKNKFIPSELQDLKKLLKEDTEADSGKNNLIQESPLYYILSEIHKLKLVNIQEFNSKKKIDKYLYRNNFMSQKLNGPAISNIFFQKKQLIRYFFISVFIYYQNKNSPLMNYLKEKAPEKNKDSKKKLMMKMKKKNF
jgi:hypothetical protein